MASRSVGVARSLKKGRSISSASKRPRESSPASKWGSSASFSRYVSSGTAGGGAAAAAGAGGLGASSSCFGDVPVAIRIPRPGGYDTLQVEEVPGGTIGANYMPGSKACKLPAIERETLWTDGPEAPSGLNDMCLVDTAYAGCNYADICIRWGIYASAKEFVGFPITPGFEFSGVVRDVQPGVTDLRVGDAVFGVSLFGGYSSQITVPRKQLFRIPEGWKFQHAAATPAVYLTAWYAMFELGACKRGDVILIHSAAGGVGSMLAQLGHISGCRVVGVVGAPHKKRHAYLSGCDEVIDKSSCDMWAEARKLSARGFDRVFDANGVATLKGSYEILAPTGRVIIYGFHSMLPRSGGVLGVWEWTKLALDYVRTPRFNPLSMTSDNKSAMAFNLSFLFENEDILQRAMSEWADWVAMGKLKPPQTTIYPLSRTAEAHAALESGLTTGKLVLRTCSRDRLAEMKLSRRGGPSEVSLGRDVKPSAGDSTGQAERETANRHAGEVRGSGKDEPSSLSGQSSPSVGAVAIDDNKSKGRESSPASSKRRRV